MSHSRFLINWFLVAILTLSLGAVYTKTLAPGLSWAHNGADGGDYISAVVTGGIPHPTGYPTYLILASVFQKIPLGSPAFRMNLFSLVCAVVAAVFVYLAVARYLLAKQLNWLAGGIAALAYGLSPLVWSQAVITEVYSLQALFVALIVNLWFYGFYLKPEKMIIYDVTIGLVASLAFGNHLTTMFLFPLVFSMGGAIRKERLEKAAGLQGWLRGWKIRWISIARRFGAFLAGLMVYLVLPLRAFSGASINWGDPVTLNNFLWLVSGKLYSGLVFGVPRDYIVPRIQYWVHLIIDQFGWLGIFVGIYGLLSIRGETVKKIYLGMGWLFFVFSIFAIGYNSYDSDVYLIPAFMVAAIWIGIGTEELIERASHRSSWLGIFTGGVILIGLIIPAIFHYPETDASHDQRAEDFGRDVFHSAPSQAIIFTQGDEATFALQYFQYALHQRPDIALVAINLMPYDWYRRNLVSAYPTLLVPDHATLSWDSTIIQANPGRPVCDASYKNVIDFSCR
jgi:hypothetical protein